MRRLALLFLALATFACTATPTDAPAAGSPGHDAATEGAAPPSTEGAAPPPLHPRVDRLPATTVRIVPTTGSGPVAVAARVAAAPEERQQGLMGVRDLPDGAGMLFVFDGTRRGGFWMRDTLVALDIAFVADSGRIEAILTMEPCLAEPCPVHDPHVAYRWALEVPAGWFARQGVQRGDPVSWDPPAAAGAQ